METDLTSDDNEKYAEFQKNLIVWKLGGTAVGYAMNPLFQKNLIVWKRVSLIGLGIQPYEFQKNLIVWKQK